MCVPDQAALGESVRSDAGDAQRACVTATDALRRRRWRSPGCWGDASHESSSRTVRGTRLLALASRAVLRGFGVGSTVSQADDASLAPREIGTATLKTGGSAGRSQGELESRCTPAAASRRDSRSNSASERAAASTRACDASATAAACDVHGASRAFVCDVA